MEKTDYLYIQTTKELEKFCEVLKQESFITFDTEFLRERTYYSKLCLIQIAGEKEAAIIDTLSENIDLKAFYTLMANEDILKICHSGRQDLEIIYTQSGIIPKPLFDTQIAASVCGFGDQIGYEQLVAQTINGKIDKSQRFTDWSHRPLSEKQLDYALADVTFLRDVYKILHADLEKNARLSWIEDEMATLIDPETYEQKPENAWQRLKLRIRKPVEFAVLKKLAEWREQEAQKKDIPRGHIIKDDGLLELAIRRPTSLKELKAMRAVPSTILKGTQGENIFNLIKDVIKQESSSFPALPKAKKSNEGMRAILDILRILLKICAHEQNVAPKIIANSADLEELANKGDQAQINALQGWRKEIFGQKALDFLKGKTAITMKEKKPIFIET